MERTRHFDFNFTDCQLTNELNAQDENYIKRKCRGASIWLVPT
jgi:hypothetical protein